MVMNTDNPSGWIYRGYDVTPDEEREGVFWIDESGVHRNAKDLEAAQQQINAHKKRLFTKASESRMKEGRLS
jgi:hypothetical protein